jgi:hypothetical protein
VFDVVECRGCLLVWWFAQTDAHLFDMYFRAEGLHAGLLLIFPGFALRCASTQPLTRRVIYIGLVMNK